MKKIKLTLLLGFWSIVLFSQSVCPPEGDATHEKEKQLNRLKNRSVEFMDGANVLPLEDLLAPGNDTARFTSEQYVTVSGYVVYYAPGDAESCNCHSDDKKNHDVHIYIGKKKNSKKKDCIIVDITPPYKSSHSIDLKKLKGKKVSVTGYLMFDFEHKGNAANTCMKCTRIWRRTAWEIHPVVKIELKEP